MTKETDSKLVQVRYPGPVRRVTIHWNGQKWAITGQVHVARMTLPEPARLPDGEKSLGFWIEASNEKGEIFHRQVLPDPFLGMEQFEEGGRMYRLDHPPHDLTLEVLIPGVKEVSQLHLVDNTAGGKPHGEKAHGAAKRTVLKLDDTEGKKDDPAGGHTH